MTGLKGRTAIITGAAGGIGFAIAKKLGTLGARVALFDIDAHSIDQASKKLSEKNIEALGVVCDVCDESSVKEAFTATREEFSSIEILINNAGIISFESLLDTSLRTISAYYEC